MARLSELTNAAAVFEAVREFREVGRVAFVGQLGFEPSRDHFLLLGGELFDTKPIVARAFAIEHPEAAPLGPKSFSGGSAGAGRALERLGFEVVTRAQLHPPELGEEHADRTALYEKYGGDKIAGVIRLPGEDIINVFSDASGPYADDPPTLTEPFGYRGEGLSGPQRVEGGGNALLERARISGEAVRFWYRPVGEPFTFLSWAAVLGRSWIVGQGQDGVARPELDWQLEAVPSPSPEGWPSDVKLARQEAAESIEDNPQVPEAAPSPSYGDLLNRVNSRGQNRRPSGVVRTDYARSSAARRAVLIRCGGKCESPRCTGMPAEPNRRGEPILDVDHVKDLALGGDDHPLNMVALCPNCHAIKTRGAKAASYRRQLLRVARAAHDALLAGGEQSVLDLK